MEKEKEKGAGEERAEKKMNEERKRKGEKKIKMEKSEDEEKKLQNLSNPTTV